MNKQELIEKIDNLQYSLSWNIPRINKEIVLDLIKQLDEPQKPVVKQFVADWYEDNKDMLETNLFECIYGIYKKRGQNIFTTFEEWLVDEHTTPFQTIVNMHQFGYEVEKEPKYTVKLTKTQQYLYCIDNDFTFVTYARPDDNPRLYHTRKELEEAGFGGVFNSPLFEVEEVE